MTVVVRLVVTHVKIPRNLAPEKNPHSASPVKAGRLSWYDGSMNTERTDTEVIVPGMAFIIRSWLPRDWATALTEQIVEETYDKWRGQLKFGSRGGRFFDRGHTMSRFGDAGITYSFKGRPKPVHPMTDGINAVRGALSRSRIFEGNVLGDPTDAIGSWYPNCCVLNTYEPTSSLYPHRDSTYIPQLGRDPIIASVSFGCTRTFRLVPHDAVTGKYVKSKKTIDIELAHGDLFVMHGACDSNYKHGIPEEPERTGTRLSLTFRRHRS